MANPFRRLLSRNLECEVIDQVASDLLAAAVDKLRSQFAKSRLQSHRELADIAFRAFQDFALYDNSGFPALGHASRQAAGNITGLPLEEDDGFSRRELDQLVEHYDSGLATPALSRLGDPNHEVAESADTQVEGSEPDPIPDAATDQGLESQGFPVRRGRPPKRK